MGLTRVGLGNTKANSAALVRLATVLKSHSLLLYRLVSLCPNLLSRKSYQPGRGC